MRIFMGFFVYQLFQTAFVFYWKVDISAYMHTSVYWSNDSLPPTWNETGAFLFLCTTSVFNAAGIAHLLAVVGLVVTKETPLCVAAF